MPRTNSKLVVLSSVLAAVCVATVVPTAPAIAATATPAERVKAVPKGELKNPLAATPEIIAEGKALYQAKTCGACHGGNGGGIHCPSLINDAWIYGGDDDTIFRLVTLGSEQMLSQGYSRGDQEKHAGPMPGFGEAIIDEQELWKIVAYIRSLRPGDSVMPR
jgi:mono/diheme cytochrome c family protein